MRQFRDNLRGPDHSLQRIIDLMGHASGQLAEGDHFFVLHPVLFQVRQSNIQENQIRGR